MKYVVRAQEVKDIEKIHEMRIDPRNAKNIISTPYESLDAFRKRRTDFIDDNTYLLVCVDQESQVVVGNCALKIEPQLRLNHVATIAILVDADLHGQGIGSQMMASMIDLGFNYLKLRRIQLQVNVDNENAINLYKKFGFEIEGMLKDYTKYDNQYHDGYVMALINKGDYEK